MIKRDGERQRFDRRKLRAALVSAAHKRPVIASDIEAIVDRIETAAGDGGGELSAERIGELCLEGLRELDSGRLPAVRRNAAVRADPENSGAARSRPVPSGLRARIPSSPRKPLEGEDLMTEIAAKDAQTARRD